MGSPPLAQKTCYQAERSEILPLIPETAQRILDVGCARGYLGRAIKAARPCEIVGIERDAQMAEEAGRYLDRVFCEDVESFLPPFSPGHFDLILMLDILEHLADPWKVLAEYQRYLAKDGVLIISLPNVRHYRVVGRLILGHWEYRESGILDSAHLRFFTWKSILGLLEGAGLVLMAVEKIVRARPIARLINWLCFNRLEPFLVQQYVVKAKKRA